MLNLLKEACFTKDIHLNPEELNFLVASFAQCIRRKVDNLGLKVPYASNDDIQFFIKSFIALSMVPLSKIDDAFFILLENKSKLFEKLTTTNNLLIVNANRGRGLRGSRGQRGGRVGRGRGRNFESKLWNHANTIDPRTNNHVEGFHNKLNKWIAKPHPNIYQLISVFQKINTKISVDYEFRLLGKSGPKRRAIDVEKDNRYQNLLENLEMNVIDLQQYLRSCSFLVNFNSIMNMV
ncbi:unnamed protein product [Brachionus calyciflorus]|uniref:Uncharacterized protein n=1 Tax=Brachionus calyciflorus TaxID=104777 RepID=A0A814K0T2_9BILA|nr:unnamed protein product [Brachionus calyciflorus]